MMLIKLILAHLLGDFILQPNSWVVAKERKQLKAWQLYVHTLIHFALRKRFNNFDLIKFKKLVEVYRDDIVRKWVDFFVFNKAIEPERITIKL